jgi:hypothetical protein
MKLARQEKYTIEKLDDWKGTRAGILCWNIHQNLSPTSPFKILRRGKQPTKTFES